MRWYVADKDYVNHLHSIDKKVEKIDYKDSFKPYFGVVMDIGGHNYYLPISSPKHKHKRMKNNKDFLKVIDHSDTSTGDGKLIAVLNINNMIPIPDEYITRLDYNDVDKYKVFANDSLKEIYVDLLRKELEIIKSMSDKIESNATSLYEHYKAYPTSKLSSRCCNFIELEKSKDNYKK